MERGDYLILKKSRALVELSTNQPTVQEGDKCETPQKAVFQEDYNEVNLKKEGYSDEYNKLRSEGIIRHSDGT
jgi:hypothetical protein